MQKSILLLTILIFLSAGNMSGGELREIATIEISIEKLLPSVKNYSTEIKLSNKKKLGDYYTYNVDEIIEPYIKDISDSLRKDIVVIAENSSGESVAASYSDFDKSTSFLPGILIYKKVTGSIGDSVRAFDKKDKKGEVDFKVIDEQLDIATKRIIYLQIKSMFSNEKNKLMMERTLIFPQDASAKRWITDVNKLHIYIYSR